MWQHFHSDAVEPLLEKFTGFVRVPLADAPEFEKWYDDLVEQQLLANTTGDRSRASFLSKKKTKVLRYALPSAFLEQFFTGQLRVLRKKLSRMYTTPSRQAT